MSRVFQRMPIEELYALLEIELLKPVPDLSKLIALFIDKQL